MRLDHLLSKEHRPDAFVVSGPCNARSVPECGAAGALGGTSILAPWTFLVLASTAHVSWVWNAGPAWGAVPDTLLGPEGSDLPACELVVFPLGSSRQEREGCGPLSRSNRQAADCLVGAGYGEGPPVC